MSESQKSAQRMENDATYAAGSRSHVASEDPLVRYIVRWRLERTIERLQSHFGNHLGMHSSVLCLCAGEGGEASWLCDLGYRDVTFSDLSPMAVKAGHARDPRLKGLVLDAENLALEDGSYDLVIVQDGLHHLPSPVRGFTEMLRVARRAAAFMEPHLSIAGKLAGTKWERNGDAINYVFRWTTQLVEDVASSYLGPESFDNLSFSYWHHNPSFQKIANKLGGGRTAISALAGLKWTLDHTMGFAGNQFSGIVAKRVTKD